ncbi:HAD family hydrolase [Desulfolucanica intricata]|uniref:HAD family hydrolase n=1 Tax=Desulfolucanica intricata TaxID=1285191 RepID=UPI00083263D3|nr:HAD family hydrolase [Desulfolucanica intricata]
MLSIDVPGKGMLNLKYIVLDYNGTIAFDGYLIPGVKERLNQLSKFLSIYILTADTFGKAGNECKVINGELSILTQPIGVEEKEKFIIKLGAENVVAVGNGNNDNLMLLRAGLGIVVLGPEGASVKAIQNADVMVKDIGEALDLLLNPKRLIATLRE